MLSFVNNELAVPKDLRCTIATGPARVYAALYNWAALCRMLPVCWPTLATSLPRAFHLCLRLSSHSVTSCERRAVTHFWSAKVEHSILPSSGHRCEHWIYSGGGSFLRRRSDSIQESNHHSYYFILIRLVDSYMFLYLYTRCMKIKITIIPTFI